MRIPSPRLKWKLPGPLWKTLFHLQRPCGSFHFNLRQCTPLTPNLPELNKSNRGPLSGHDLSATAWKLSNIPPLSDEPREEQKDWFLSLTKKKTNPMFAWDPFAFHLEMLLYPCDRFFAAPRLYVPSGVDSTYSAAFVKFEEGNIQLLYPMNQEKNKRTGSFLLLKKEKTSNVCLGSLRFSFGDVALPM